MEVTKRWRNLQSPSEVPILSQHSAVVHDGIMFEVCDFGDP